MGAVLCMNLLAVSGCDSVVQSAVVEEKDESEKRGEQENSSGNSCRTGRGTGNLSGNNPGGFKISGPGG